MNGKLCSTSGPLLPEEVDQFKYLGSTQTKDGTPKKEMKIGLVQAHSVMTRLHYGKTKHKLLGLSILLYGRESWTLTAYLERRVQVFENKCYRWMLGISYREQKANEKAWQQVNILAGRQELLLSTAKRHKLSWFDHVCHYDMLPDFMLQVTVDVRCHRGRPCKSYKGNIKEWTGQSMSPLLLITDDRSRGAAIIVKVPQRRLSITGIS